jgi:hypothetical protein
MLLTLILSPEGRGDRRLEATIMWYGRHGSFVKRVFFKNEPK